MNLLDAFHSLQGAQHVLWRHRRAGTDASKPGYAAFAGHFLSFSTILIPVTDSTSSYFVF